MNSENFSDEVASAGGDAARVETCATCRRPLTRRGSHGECLRCMMGFAMMLPEEETRTNTPSKSSLLPTGLLRYGHFEVAVDVAGFPVELGSGGMAITYRAYDTVLHRRWP